MKEIIKVDKLNVSKANIVPISVVKQGNNIILEVNLVKDNKEFDISNQKVTLAAKLPNGAIQQQVSSITSNKSFLTIVLNNSIVSVAGLVELELSFSDVDGSITTSSFFLEVSSKVLNDAALESSDYIEGVEKVITDIKFDYENLRRVIIDDNISILLQNQINENKSKLTEIDKNIALLGEENANNKKDISNLDKIAIKKDAAGNIVDPLNVSSNITPSSDNAFQIGTSTNRFKEIHIGNPLLEENGYVDITNNVRIEYGSKIFNSRGRNWQGGDIVFKSNFSKILSVIAVANSGKAHGFGYVALSDYTLTKTGVYFKTDTDGTFEVNYTVMGIL